MACSVIGTAGFTDCCSLNTDRAKKRPRSVKSAAGEQTGCPCGQPVLDLERHAEAHAVGLSQLVVEDRVGTGVVASTNGGALLIRLLTCPHSVSP